MGSGIDILLEARVLVRELGSSGGMGRDRSPGCDGDVREVKG